MFSMETVIKWIIAVIVLVTLIFLAFAILPSIAGVGSNLPWGFFR